MATVRPPSHRMGPLGVGIAVGLSILACLLIVCLLEHCCKKICHCRRESFKKITLKRLGWKKSPQPFSVSAIVAKREK